MTGFVIHLQLILPVAAFKNRCIEREGEREREDLTCTEIEVECYLGHLLIVLTS